MSRIKKKVKHSYSSSLENDRLKAKAEAFYLSARRNEPSPKSSPKPAPPKKLKAKPTRKALPEVVKELKPPRAKSGPKPNPVRINGKVYESAALAARALGVTENTVHSAVSKGNVDTVGTGRARPNNGGGKRKPVHVGSTVFESMAEASVALGFHHKHIARVRREGTKGEREALVRAMMKYEARKQHEEMKKRNKAIQLKD